MATIGLEIQSGQYVEIRGDTSMQECIDAVSLAVERVGAVPCPNLTSIAHEAERIQTLSGDWLRKPSPFLLDLARTVDAVIVIERDWSSLAARCSIDECKSGMVFVALGENRFMGGKNESTLNIDLVCSGATVLCDTRYLVREGRLALDCSEPPDR